MDIRTAASIALALVLGVSTAPGLAASFDCGKAKSRVEKAVCADAELSDLDDMLGRYYHGAAAALKENTRCLAADQRDWLRHRRDECADAACLRSAYLDRLSELQALQPGINTQRRLALPPRSALLWAIAPEPYLFAAPRVAYASRPARIEGSFLRGEYGFAVREADGRTYLVIPDMMLGGASAIMLPLLAKTEPGLKVIARGHVAVGGHGDPYFDHRHCIFIHRIAPWGAPRERRTPPCILRRSAAAGRAPGCRAAPFRSRGSAHRPREYDGPSRPGQEARRQPGRGK